LWGWFGRACQCPADSAEGGGREAAARASAAWSTITEYVLYCRRYNRSDPPQQPDADGRCRGVRNGGYYYVALGVPEPGSGVNSPWAADQRPCDQCCAALAGRCHRPQSSLARAGVGTGWCCSCQCLCVGSMCRQRVPVPERARLQQPSARSPFPDALCLHCTRARRRLAATRPLHCRSSRSRTICTALTHTIPSLPLATLLLLLRLFFHHFLRSISSSHSPPRSPFPSFLPPGASPPRAPPSPSPSSPSSFSTRSYRSPFPQSPRGRSPPEPSVPRPPSGCTRAIASPVASNATLNAVPTSASAGLLPFGSLPPSFVTRAPLSALLPPGCRFFLSPHRPTLRSAPAVDPPVFWLPDTFFVLIPALFASSDSFT